MDTVFFVDKVENGKQPNLDNTKPDFKMMTGALFPNDPADSPSQNLYTLSSDELDAFKQEKIFFVIYGKASYTDFSKIQHWTKFCQFIALHGSATAQNCTNYGDIDGN